jgi:histone acetyltransferase (RNA polymerase elongator complex component)
MERAPVSDEPDAAHTEGELRLVRQAILMVSEYGTPRVVVAGLGFGNLILERCEHLAEDAGVRIVVLSAAGGRIDFAIERLEP